jgi:transcription elongation GreA/GreB family factor
MVDEETIVITETDRARLQDMIDALEFVGDPFRGHIRELESELRRALVVPSSTVDPDVATMNSRLRTRDLDTGEVNKFTLVYHDESDLFDRKLSVLSSLGIRFLGARVGDVIEWNVPRGVRRLCIEGIEYQPEASGDMT